MRLPLLACALATACGGSATEWFPSDLDRDAVIATAGEAAAAKACQAFEDYLYDQYRDSLLVEAVCTAIGIDQSADAATCANQLDHLLTKRRRIGRLGGRHLGLLLE